MKLKYKESTAPDHLIILGSCGILNKCRVVSLIFSYEYIISKL